MVSVVTGAGVGLLGTSRDVLGGAGGLGVASVGRAGAQVTVNGATGNLVVQGRDEHLVGVGPDVDLLRTYNSQGGYDGDNGDGWRLGYYRRVRADGLGSFVKTEADGHETVFSWDSGKGRYVSNEGSGAQDSLALESGRWIWRDGDSGVQEVYEADPLKAGEFRLSSIQDGAGHRIEVAYSGALISSLSTFKAGAGVADEVLRLDYSGSQLNSVSTSYVDENGQAKSRTLTRYEYQGGRLSAVITDLTPEDGSVADGKTYAQRYEYDAAGRLKKISQIDGSAQVFEYDASGRVKTITDALSGVVALSYDDANRRTTVTDELGQPTQLSYDPKGQLIEAKWTALGGKSFVQSYRYSDQGDVLSSTNAAGETTRFEYGQGPGLWTRRMDGANGVVERSYDAASRLVSETVYELADPDGVQGPALASGGRRTQYVYADASSQRVAYVVGPQGEVTRYEYNGLQQLERQTRYTGARFAGGEATLAALGAWVAGPQALTLDRQVSSYAYDLRGQVKEVRTYAQSRLSSGAVVNEQVTPSYTVYDAFGRLLSRLDANGNGVSYGYDGLDRVVTQTDADKVLSLTTYDDVQRKNRVRLKNGQVNVQSFDQRGLLVSSEVLGGASQTSVGLTRYFYDAAGRLRQTMDAAGVPSYKLYDASGCKSAEIAANGQLTEFVYDGAGRLLQSIAYAQLLSANKLATVGSATVADLRPTADALKDRVETYYYDAAGRQIGHQDAEGYLTEVQYNGAGEVVAEIGYATAQTVLRMSLVLGTVQSAGPALLRPASNADDRRTQNFMDSSGRLVAKLDAQGALTRWTYDAAGRVLLLQRSAVLLSEAQRSAASLQTLQAWPTDAQDELTQWVYDRQGRQIAQLSSEGYLSTYGYDEVGRLQSTRVYLKQAVPAGELATRRLTMLDLQTLPATLGEPQTTLRSYNKRGLLETETAPDGTVTKYFYDELQRLEKTVRALGTSEERAQQLSYDSWGRLIEQRAEGDAQGVRTTYDSAGRVLSVSNALGASTYFYYDALGRQVYSILVDAQLGGEVTETLYSGFNEVQATIRHSRRLTVADCATVKGGPQTTDLKSKVDSLGDPSDAKVQYSYNRRGQVQQAIDQLGAKTDTRYNAFGEVAGTSRDVDLAGQGSRRLESTLAYDRLGRVILSSASAAGVLSQTRTAYDALGRLQSSIDALGQETRYSYVRDFGQGRQVVVSDAAGERRTSYDALNRVVKEVDRLGNAVSYQHDAVNRELTITTSSGLRTVTRYTRHGEVWQLTDGAGQSTRYEYDSHGQLVQVTDASGVVSRSSYDLAGNLTERVVGLKLGADGKAASSGAEVRTRYSFDAANRLLVQTVDPDGLALQTKYEYDGQGRQLKVTDATNAVSTQRFDSAGHLVERVVDDVSGGLKLKTTYSYDAQGRVLSVVEGAGTAEAQRTDYVYDELGRRTAQVVDPLGLKLKTSYEYDAAGRLVRQLDASSAATVYRYDSAGRLQYVVNAAGGVTRHTVDANGQPSSVRRYATALAPNWNALSLPALDAALAALAPSAADELSRQVYDADGRLVYSVDAAGGVTESQYDGAGRVTLTRRYAQPVGLASESLTRDALQRALVKDDQRDQVSRQSYDAAGRLRFAVDAEGGVTETRYDAAGRVTETVQYAQALRGKLVDFNGAGTLGNWYVYDNANGTANGTITREWDAQKGADVTRLSGSGLTTGYQLSGDAQHAGWSSGTRRLSIDIKFSEYFIAYVSVMTTAGRRYLQYQPGSEAPKADASGEYINLGLGDAADGQWHTLDRDLQADLRLVQPGVEILSVEGLLLRGSGCIGAVSAEAGAAVLSTAQLASMVQPQLQDRHTRLSYDAAGRQRFEVNAEGYVTERQYDSLGRVRQTLRYGPALPALLASDKTTGQIAEAVRVVASFVRTSADYDAAGRLSAETDGAGGVTRYTYDAANRLSTEVRGYGTPEASTTRHGYDAAGRRIEVTRGFGSATTSTTRYEYDAMGRVRFELGARGVEAMDSDTTAARADRIRILGYDRPTAQLGTYDKDLLRKAFRTEWRYDALGRVTQTVDALKGLSSTQYDALGNAVVQTDARGYSSYQVFDKLGRVVQRVDAERYLTVSTYDSFGQLVRSLRVDARVQGSVQAGQAITLLAAGATAPASGAAYVQLDASKDQASSRSHDRVNRLLVETDALGNSESVLAWDAFGQKLQIRNKLGAVGRFSYDKLGRVLTETLPVQARGADGQLRDVVNEYSYDARGNRILSVEAKGLPEERRTEMRYDGADRLVRRIGQSYKALTAENVESTVTPADSWRYDARGNVIETVTHGQLGADGQTVTGLKRSLAYYDTLGRKTAEITPDRVLSLNTYDAAGNLVVQTVHATPLASSVVLSAGGTPPAPVVDLKNDRTLRTSFDGLNRKTKTVLDGVYVWDSNSAVLVISDLQRQTVTLEERFYDAVGNITERKDGRGYSCFEYFDGLGRRLLSIDAGGAGIAWTYGSAGAVATSETRYATLLMGGYARQAATLSAVAKANNPAELVEIYKGALLKPGEANRTTVFQLDRLSRVTERRVLNVASEYVDAQGTRYRQLADAVTRYEYNGLGAVTVIDELVAQTGSTVESQRWERTDISYDGLGREVLRSAPGYRDQDGAWVRPRTERVYDGLGRVVQLIQRGTLDASEADDHFTRYQYDSAGQLAATTDAENAVTRCSYDAEGNVSRRTSVGVRRSDGTRRDLVKTYQYDATGRETAVLDMDTQELRRTRYSAFGEVVAKGLGDGWEEFAEYNAMGKVSKTNSGDGAIKFYLYDANGNMTRELRTNGSLGTDWLKMTLPEASVSTQVYYRVSVYDARNLLIKTIDPAMTVLSAADAMKLQYSNEWVESWTPGPNIISQSEIGAPGLNFRSGENPEIYFEDRGAKGMKVHMSPMWYFDYDLVTTVNDRMTLNVAAYKGKGLQRFTIRPFDDSRSNGGSRGVFYGFFEVTGQGDVTVYYTKSSVDPEKVDKPDPYFRPAAMEWPAAAPQTALSFSFNFIDPVSGSTLHSAGGISTDKAGAWLDMPDSLKPASGQPPRQFDIRYSVTGGGAAVLHVTYDSVGKLTSTYQSLAAPGQMSFYVKGRNIPYARITIGSVSKVVRGTYMPQTSTSFAYTEFSCSGKAFDFTTGEQEFQLQALDSNMSTPLVDELGDAIVQSGKVAFSSSNLPPKVYRSVSQITLKSGVSVTKLQKSNAFGEVCEEWDERVADRMLAVLNDDLKSRGQAPLTALSASQVDAARITLEYNTLGKLVRKIEPETFVTAENGYRYRARPVTCYGYDLLGRLSTVTDANGNLSRKTFLAGSRGDGALVTYDFDAKGGTADTYDAGPTRGGVRQFQFDVYGQARRMVDAESHAVENEYDAMGRLTAVTRKAVLRYDGMGNQAARVDFTDRYGYDELGQRISATNALGFRTTTDYDGLGRIVQTVDGAGFKTTYKYEVKLASANYIAAMEGALSGSFSGGYVLTTVRSDGRKMVDNYEYFGHMTRHENFGGEGFALVYGSNGYLKRKYSASALVDYSYYANGYIYAINDRNSKTESRYSYDNAGNRIFESYYTLNQYGQVDYEGQGADAQANAISYDELNRIVRVRDARDVSAANRLNIRYEYDAVGNRRLVDSIYFDGAAGKLDRQTYWYAYDELNRFVVTKGRLNTTDWASTRDDKVYNARRGVDISDQSVSIVAGEDGIAIGYDKNSQRVRAQYVYNGAAVDEEYRYSDDGYLQLTRQGGVLKVSRELDAIGRTVVQHDFSSSGGVSVAMRHMASTYDRANRLLLQSYVDDADDARNYTVSYFYYERLADGAPRGLYDAANASMSATGAGTLAKTVAHQTKAGGDASKDTVTTYKYIYQDQTQQFKITKVAPDVSPGVMNFSYDVNGNLMGTYDEVANVRNTYLTTITGQVLSRTRVQGSRTTKHYFFYADSNRVGDVGDTPDEITRVSYAEQLALKDAQRANSAAKGRTYQTLVSPAEYEKDSSRGRPVRVSPEVYRSTADFDQNYEPINDNYPGAAASTYTVQRNSETLASVAQALWGDAAMWYLIADANGLTASAVLKAGQLLVIPNKVTNIHNNAKTWRPYQAGEAIGKTDPTTPTPPPPKNSGCGGLGMLLMVVVAVAVTVVTQGAAAQAMSGLVSTLGSTAVTAASWAAGAAVGSIASQAVGLAIGQIDSFSWRAVGQAALGGAISGGISAMASANGVLSGLNGSGWQYAAGKAALGSAASMALRGDWDWRGIMISAVSAGVGSAVGSTMGDTDFGKSMGGFGARFAGGLAGGVATTALMGGNRRNYETVFMSSLGNAIGDSIAYGGNSGGVTRPDANTVIDNRVRPASAGSEEFLRELTGMMGSPSPVDSSNDVLVAGPGGAPTERSLQRNIDELKRLSEEVRKFPTAGPTVAPSSSSDGGGRLILESVAGTADSGTVRTLQASPFEPIQRIEAEPLMLLSSGVTPQDIQPVPALSMNVQAVNDAKAIAGTLNIYGSALDSAMQGKWSQAWAHLNYEPSDAARAAIYARVFPQANPVLARIDAAAGGPIGAAAVLATNSSSPRDQFYAAQFGMHADALSGSFTGVYPQTLTAKAPTGAQLASRVKGSRPIDYAKTYEADIRGLYGEVPFQKRTYEAFVNGGWVNGVADNVAVLNGRATAIEAKYVRDWSKSLRNPASPEGNMPWAVAEQQRMLEQAVKYSSAFEQTIYHTNSVDLANHYTPLFERAGATNFQFVITPPITPNPRSGR